VAEVAEAVAADAGAETMNETRDRVGLGWRPDIATGILAHQDEIDLVEVIAEDYFEVSDRSVRALATLGKQIPIALHGIGMGVASCAPVDQEYFDRMARLVERLRPESWSEHLAFVRVGDKEIGHLAAPPRTRLNVEGTGENIYRAERTVGSRPHVENVATLLDPPGSAMGEAEWIREILDATQCELLFDLHNVYANGTNHGYKPEEFLHTVGPSRIRYLHIAGGKSVCTPDGKMRIVDDHLHDVPDPVYALLEEVAAVAPHGLTVILERDGDFPTMDDLLNQTRRARTAMARGRARNKRNKERAA
jgi:uncharacterized protein (UPF0276 family)